MLERPIFHPSVQWPSRPRDARGRAHGGRIIRKMARCPAGPLQGFVDHMKNASAVLAPPPPAARLSIGVTGHRAGNASFAANCVQPLFDA
jgi:hypothetical protein